MSFSFSVICRKGDAKRFIKSASLPEPVEQFITHSVAGLTGGDDTIVEIAANGHLATGSGSYEHSTAAISVNAVCVSYPS